MSGGSALVRLLQGRQTVLSLTLTALTAMASAGLLVLFLADLNRYLRVAASEPGELWRPALVLLAAALASFATQALLFHSAYGAVHTIRMRVARIVADARLEALERFGLERIITILTTDVRALVSFFAFVPNAVISSLMLVFAAGYLLWLSLPVGLVVVAGVALLTWAGLVRTKRAAPAAREVQRHTESTLRHVRQLVRGAREIRLSRARRDALVERDLLRSSESTAVLAIRQSDSFGRHAEIVKATSFAFFLAVLAYARIDPAFGVSGAGAVMVVLLFIQQPIRLINYGWVRLSPFFLALENLSHLEATLAGSAERADRSRGRFNGAWSSIELVGARFRYQGGGFALGPINVSLRRGECVFLTGVNGAGKTTFGKALCGLYPLSQGSLRLDGCPLSNEDLLDYRELFAVAFADTYLFEDIVPGDGVGLGDVRELVTSMQLDGKVSVSDDLTFSTSDLSIGQRDRLALIDLLAQQREILVLDEWPANQDPMFRERFYTQILPMLRSEGRTIVVISHDDRYYSLADRLWRLDDGRISQLPSLAH